MSNESLKRVFQKLFEFKCKHGKSGHILCSVSKEKVQENPVNSKSKEDKLILEARKKPLYVVGGRKRKREFDSDSKREEFELYKKREKHFASIAKRGITHIFNAINAHQNEVNIKLTEAGKSETKKEKVISSTSKSSFVQRLKTKPAKKTFTIEASL